MMADADDGIVPAERLHGTAVPEDRRGYRRVALIVATALFMQNLDSTILATALPTMARDFGVAPTSMSLALTAYLLALAVFIPASGYAADRFGSRRVFQSAIAVFVGGSVACGLVPNLELLVVARFVQGIGGAMMVPVGRLVLLRSVDRRDLVSAMSWLSMPAMIGPILGPPVGGAIVTWLDWRWIFWMNLPMGALGIALVHRYIDDVRDGGHRRFDWPGFLLSGFGLGSVISGLQLLVRAGRTDAALPLLGAGIFAGAIYLRRSRRVLMPILDLSLLRIATFRLSVIGGTLSRINQGAQPFLLPLMLQLAFGMSAAKSGSITVATAIGSFAMKGAVRPLLRRLGFRRALSAISILAPAAYAVTGLFGPGWPIPAMFAVLLVCGFLTSLQFTAYNTIAYADVPKAQMSQATSFYATFQQVALSLGVCCGSGALTLAVRWHADTRPMVRDFPAAIWTVALIAAMAVLVNSRFAADAGEELSGHHGSARGR